MQVVELYFRLAVAFSRHLFLPHVEVSVALLVLSVSCWWWFGGGGGGGVGAGRGGVVVWVLVGLTVVSMMQVWMDVRARWKLKEVLRYGEDEHHLERLETSYKRLERAVDEQVMNVVAQGSDAVPVVDYDVLEQGNGEEVEELRQRVRQAGVVIIRGVVPEAGEMYERVRAYAKENEEEVVGMPPWSPQIIEMYYSEAQVEARQHPRLQRVARFLNGLWDADEGDLDVDADVSYLDRLRLRDPGDESLQLGPHMDNGSLERWSHESYQRVYRKVFNGTWEELNAWEAHYRVRTKEIEAPNTSTFFRSMQGWLALTEQGPGDGTLRVIPFLREAVSYVLLRPLVGKDVATSAEFSGAQAGFSLSLSEERHSRLLRGMVSIPKVRPGDYVAWHPDLPHAVEKRHNGGEISAVMYIPSAPLCEKNAVYLKKQAAAFKEGATPPDFPQMGVEQSFRGRAGVQHLSRAGRQQMGLEPYDPTEGDRVVREACNSILFG